MIEVSRSDAVERLTDTASAIEGVISVTVVGSFREGAKRFSDIDVIVILESNSWHRFEEICHAISNLHGADLGFRERSIRLNASLGPLKFDNPEELVVHLMVYSRSGHREHALASPFTCLDWERYGANFGENLKSVYPVSCLQLSDFVSSRRGLVNYLSDITRGEISYRKYMESEQEWCEVPEKWPLDERHCSEFSYHVVRFVVGNFLKWATKRNERFSAEEFFSLWTKYLPATSEFQDFFRKLEASKRESDFEFPAETISRAQAFLQRYSETLDQLQEASRRVFLCRHGETELNDGSFLGQRRDPGIRDEAPPLEEGEKFDRIISSPLRRARESASSLVPGHDIEFDERLMEIDYGECEALFLEDMERNFPEIVRAWSQGEDPRFPDGESQKDVQERVFSFLDEVGEGKSLVVTHNVVIRTVLGSLLEIPLADWYKIPVSHWEPFQIVKCFENWATDLTREQKAQILDAVYL